ncbi:alpha/beta fold hydrolase [uncultured Lamprocystis sp.]|uniref:esterase/lipase family protein n=1 Tax=uncultured Lamprocystis sp. TaxID=543132 RepID=UPI0025EA4FC7|nr:alpha/beta fold hydrolase [uncultured Lamprocystis sp.]
MCLAILFQRPAGRFAGLCIGLLLGGCQALVPSQTPSIGPSLDAAVQVLASPGSSERTRAAAATDYRELVAGRLPSLLEDAARPSDILGPTVPAQQVPPGVQAPDAFTDLRPVTRSRVTVPGLHRLGLGLPTIVRLASTDPNAPRAGYQLPRTLIALPADPAATCCTAALVQPDQIRSVRTAHGETAVAMDLEAPLDATRATGPSLLSGLVNLVRPGRFLGQPRIVFLEPFDPVKRPLVLVHGLMSTPQVWAPLVKGLLADDQVRANYQFWFYYYPTGKPVPISALQLRQALDDAVTRYRPKQPMVLIGHSMGGILSRAQVSRVTLEDAATVVPDIGILPDYSATRRALVFAPRTDVSRVVFMFTPHRGSRLATSGLGAWGTRLIRLPDTLLREFGTLADSLVGSYGGRLPNSIHGLSPESGFLRVLDATTPQVPAHTILGDRGRGNLAASSDGVVTYRSAHLPSAQSEVVVPTGHSGVGHPLAIQELLRILHQELKAGSVPRPLPSARLPVAAG